MKIKRKLNKIQSILENPDEAMSREYEVLSRTLLKELEWSKLRFRDLSPRGVQNLVVYGLSKDQGLELDIGHRS